MTNPSDDLIGVYRRHAKAWTKARGKRLDEKTWIDRFERLLRPGSDILDLGCGSGEPVARYLSEKGHIIAGIDSSPEMVEIFRTNLPDHLASVRDMRTLKLGRRFDGLVAWDSFFHLTYDDQRAMFPIFREHAKSAAPLIFSTGPSHGEALGTLEGEPLYHASLDASEYLHLLNENEFKVVEHTPEDPDCGGRTVWLARRW